MEIVIVPVWRRPDFAHAALVRLALSDAGDDAQFRICVDRGGARELAAVINRFADRVGRARVKVVRRRRHRYRGNSYNVLEAYREAVKEGADLVHLVEEDVLVGRDYFDYHRRAHDLVPDAFCVSACRNQQFPLGVDPPPTPDAVWRHGSYQSLGVSWRPQQLAAVLAHATPGYYRDPVGYCGRVFPGTRLHAGAAEQDGLIHRVLEERGLAAVYPGAPRAYHAGWTGYNRRGVRLSGSLDARAMRIMTMTADELNAHAESYPDHATTPLDAARPPVTRVFNWPDTG